MPDLAGTVMDPTTYEHQMVLVTNEGDRPMKLLFHGNRYTLEPGRKTPIPYLAMVLWFGNPRTFDSSTDPERHFRAKERERLSSKWGLGFDKWFADPDDLAPGETPRTSTFHPALPEQPEEYVETQILGRRQFMHPRLPRVRVETYEGERIITILDDPFGEFSGGRDPASGDTKSMVEDLQRQLEINRQNQLLMLQALSAVNPEVADQMAANLATRPDVVTSETGLPVWPTATDTSATADPTPTASTPASRSSLGDESGLTDALESDPVPTKRVTRPSK